MTRPERTFERNLDFSQWMRTHLRDSFNGLIAHDVDWILLNYCTGFFIVLEEKTHRQKSNRYTGTAQTVMLKMLDEMLSMGSYLNQRFETSKNPATGVVYQYKGAYILEFIKGTDPANAEKIYLNGRPIDAETLIRLLNLDDEALLDRYASSWIEENLRKQRQNLTGRCE
jgi:hypothetical protein